MKTTFFLFALIFISACSNDPGEIEIKSNTNPSKDFVDFPDTLSNDSSGFLFYSDRAEVLIKRKKYYEAIAIITRGEHLAVDRANCYMYKASIWAFIHTKAAEDSLLFCMERAIHIEPKNSFYYFIRSRFLNDLGRNLEALKDIEIAIKYSPSEKGYVNQRGMYKMAVGDFKGAAEDLKIVSSQNEQNVEIYLAQSIVYNQLDMHKEALAAATKLIELDSNIAQAYTIRGNALHYLKRKNESIRDFYKARNLGDSTAAEYLRKYKR